MTSREKLLSTSLHYASQEGETAAVKFLLNQADIQVNELDPVGRTPLHIASLQGHTEIVKLLLNHPDIQVNAPAWNGATPLLWAFSEGNKEIANLLKAKGGTMDESKLDEMDNSECEMMSGDEFDY